ncbi:hypothetical protein [Spiroplasma taiwanense]|uniref:Uncharacterized protein n=1 Tax=Spiroplasma taiwanense CT-1 TaxID=1276220 RepID=S5MHR3_9MOLU|nr:hypothetical protein [Spiroplasma taiwanense]AGR41420.1 hypothetical protein STAIW_v1c08320 [Spiroplasma taiwanense CT-1]
MANKINNQKIKVSRFLIPKYKIMYFNVNEWIKDLQKTWKEENTFEGPIKINIIQIKIFNLDLLSKIFYF